MSATGDDFGTCRRALEQNVPSYTIPAPGARRSRRESTIQPGKLVRPCTATLIVTPPNLFSHWKIELATHIEGDAIKTLYLDSNEIATPPAEELLLYDVILMTKRRFEEEMALETSLKNVCKCATGVAGCDAPASAGVLPDSTCQSGASYIAITSGADTEGCRCGKDQYHSPLEDLHFLRIIVDEGHDFSSFGRQNNAVFALQKIHVERRWIISGTPSSGLMGVEANTAILETLGGIGESDCRVVRDILENRRSSGLELDLDPSVRKAALQQERKDLEKLGSIVVDFLNLKPWSNGKMGDDVASWKQYVIPSADGERKPRSLASVLETLVVRHRIEDVEKDIKLPPLYNKTVYLEPNYHDKLSLNLFIMTLAVNAVTSERVDEDY
ncbi:MAG: hypothetical protein Q9218_007942, partial [Villophora microphyllina]